MSNPLHCKLFELPLGSRFRYLSQPFGLSQSLGDGYILVDRGGCGTVAQAPPSGQQAGYWPGQGIYSAADTPKQFRELTVELIPVVAA